ncbi:MAG: RodZ domain-containing protein [Elusimicrobiota bacterium]
MNKLRKIRKDKGISLEQVARETKVPLDKLKAIEEDDFSQFEARFYAAGFLKIYAEYLGIDDEDIQADLSLLPNIGPITQLPKTYYAPSKTGRSTLITVLTAAVLIVISGFLLKGKAAEFLLKFYSSHDSVAVYPDTAPYTYDPVVIKSITIEPTWVRITADGEIIHEGIIAGGKENIWQATSRLKIRVGNANGLQLYYKNILTEEYDSIDMSEGNTKGVCEMEFFNESG